MQTPTTYHERQQLITLQSAHQTPISNLQTNPAHRRNNQRLQISTIAKNNKIEGQYRTANGTNVFLNKNTGSVSPIKIIRNQENNLLSLLK